MFGFIRDIIENYLNDKWNEIAMAWAVNENWGNEY